MRKYPKKTKLKIGIARNERLCERAAGLAGDSTAPPSLPPAARHGTARHGTARTPTATHTPEMFAERFTVPAGAGQGRAGVWGAVGIGFGPCCPMWS